MIRINMKPKWRMSCKYKSKQTFYFSHKPRFDAARGCASELWSERPVGHDLAHRQEVSNLPY